METARHSRPLERRARICRIHSVGAPRGARVLLHASTACGAVRTRSSVLLCDCGEDDLWGVSFRVDGPGVEGSGGVCEGVWIVGIGTTELSPPANNSPPLPRSTI